MGKVKHGMRHTRFYRIWLSMKARATNPNCKDYPRYGAKGIGLSPDWHTFVNFMDDMHETYVEHVTTHGEFDTQIDRKENALGYSKENCRWVTIRQQLNNRSTYAAVGTNGRKTNWGKSHAKQNS